MSNKHGDAVVHHGQACCNERLQKTIGLWGHFFCLFFYETHLASLKSLTCCAELSAAGFLPQGKSSIQLLGNSSRHCSVSRCSYRVISQLSRIWKRSALLFTYGTGTLSGMIYSSQFMQRHEHCYYNKTPLCKYLMNGNMIFDHGSLISIIFDISIANFVCRVRQVVRSKRFTFCHSLSHERILTCAP